MAVERVGDWNRVTALIGNLANEMQQARTISLQRWGLKAEGLAKNHIRDQDLSWTKLKAETIATKIRKGYSDNILVMTSDYFQAITSWVYDKEVALAGVKKVAVNSEGQQIADIAAVHEFGSNSGNIPARPLWQPVFAETMEWYVKSDSRPDIIFMERIKRYL